MSHAWRDVTRHVRIGDAEVGRARRGAGVGAIPAAILAQQRAAGNRAVAGVLGEGRTNSVVVQRQSFLTALPPELSWETLSRVPWRDFVGLRAVSRVHRDWINGVVAERYGAWSPENMLTFWVVDLRGARRLTLFEIVELAGSLGAQAFWPAFWRAVARVHVPDQAASGNVGILLALGQKFGLAGSVDFIGAMVALGYSAGFNHLSFLESYLAALERSDAAEIGAAAAKERRAEIERAMEIELGTVDEDGDVYFDAAVSSLVPAAGGAGQLETRDFLLQWLRQDAKETPNRKFKTLADRLAAALRKLDAELGQGRGMPSRADTPVSSLRYVQRALAQVEWEALVTLHAALAQQPGLSLKYDGACRAGVVDAGGLAEALTVLFDAVHVAQEADTARRGERAKTAAKPVENRYQQATRERWARRAARAPQAEEEKGGPSAATPDPVSRRDPDEDGRTGEEPALTYRGVVYTRFASKCYGRVDRAKLGRDCTDQQLNAFESAVAHGLALRARGESGVKQRGDYYQVKLSDVDARGAGFTNGAETRLRSAVASSEVRADRYGIKYFVFDRTQSAHAGGHI
ncbi:hypothetical protein [Amycolatopsis sp.]|uniref:hypothetical protein n=1 Tax=Amycolatopsis sp. TaxID=37632 RepID=UPI002D807CF0|nr:hypothetical protein [Amycolatopsis sp.]HET6708941.1 hypothetical protein [Amycolatopsis sp.]